MNTSYVSGGGTGTYDLWFTTENIDCAGCSEVIFENVPAYKTDAIYIYGLSFFDESNEFISGVGVNEVTDAQNISSAGDYVIAGTATIPDGAKSVRFSLTTSTPYNNVYATATFGP